MRIPEVEELRAAVAGGRTVPATLVAGGDDALLDAVLSVLADGLKSSGAAVSVVRLDARPARTDAWTRLDEIAGTVPLFGEAFVVLVDGCDAGKSPPELKRVLASPPPHLRLVLRTERKAAGLGKAVEAAGGMVVTPVEVKEWDIPSVIEAAAREAGVVLDRGAVAALADMAGSDRGAIDNAIRAVRAYRGPGARVSEEDLLGLVQRSRMPMPWDLTDAINRRDLKAALKVASRELADGGSAVSLFHRVVRQARLLLQAVDMVKRKVPDEEAAEALKLKPYPWKKLRESASRWRVEELAAFLREAPAMEQLSKRSKSNVSEETVVADLLARLIGSGGGPAQRGAAGGRGR